MAKEAGFNGIYLIQMVNNDESVKIESCVVDAKVDFEPNKTLSTRNAYAVSLWRIRRFIYNKFVKKNKLYQYFYDVVNYKSFCSTLLRKKYVRSANYFYSMVVDWDNTARKQKRGWIMKNSSPSLFAKYFKRVYLNSIKENKPFIFIFAWNEWGEGAYLEPDTRNQYGYLEKIKEIVKER